MLASDEAVSHALKDQFGSDIKTLAKLIEKPYFARIEVEEEEQGRAKTIEYKIGFAANSDCRIIDWRKAPISKLYYEYREGEDYSELIQGRERQGRVVMRNQLDIEHGALRRITSSQGQFLFVDGQWQKLEQTGKTLREHYGKLPSILSLITKEQFQLITEDADTAVLIQGIAGSGKTTVALHRLSWLLHEDNSELREKDCVILVLSKSLQAYIKNSLPALQIEETPVHTFQDWSFRIVQSIAQYTKEPLSPQRPADRSPAGIGRLKRSLALLKALELHVRRQSDNVRKLLSEKLQWESLPSGMRAIFERGIDKKFPAGLLLNEVHTSVRIAGERVDPSNTKAAGVASARALIEEQLALVADLKADILSILSRPKAILEQDDTKLLSESLIRDAFERTRVNFERGCIDPADDALIVRLFELKFGGLPMHGNTIGKYGHIIVDEVQDLSPIDIENVLGAVADMRKLTLVGDVQQRLDESASFPGWDRLRNDILLKDSIPRFVTLEVSHRSTLPIMKLAEHVQQKSIVKDGRAGRVPIYFKCRRESDGVGTSINWLQKALERYPTAITAVVCADEDIARQTYKYLQPTFGPVIRLGTHDTFSFEEGIVVTDVRQVKGLEFCNVLLWNPSRRAFPAGEDIARNMLYVAITRAEENLCIVCWQPPTEFLPPITSKLVRGIDLTIDDEEEERLRAEGR